MSDQDDSELIEMALTRQARHGKLVLRNRVWINGIGYNPATYILTHVGPAPVIEPSEVTIRRMRDEDWPDRQS